MKGKSLSHVRLFVTPWTAAYQALPSTGFSKSKLYSHNKSCFLGAYAQRWLAKCYIFSSFLFSCFNGVPFYPRTLANWAATGRLLITKAKGSGKCRKLHPEAWKFSLEMPCNSSTHFWGRGLCFPIRDWIQALTAKVPSPNHRPGREFPQLMF